jgi:hypothetical protein
MDGNEENNQAPQPPLNPYVRRQQEKAQQTYNQMIQSGVNPDTAKERAQGFLNAHTDIQERQPVQQLAPTPDGVVTEFMKSTWNGFAPATLKLIPDLTSMATNAIGLHSDALDEWTDHADKWIDENVKAYIDPEHEKGFLEQDPQGNYKFTNLRSVSNGIGNALGTVAQFIAMAFATGGTGDLAEASDAIKVATEAGDADGLAKATQAYKSAQAGLTMTKAASGSLIFAPQIYEDGLRNGLTHQDAARLGLALSVPLGLLGTVSGAEQKVLEKLVAGDMLEEGVVKELNEKGILRGLEGRRAGEALSEEDFKATMKATLTDAAALTKRLVNSKVAATSAKEFGQMYLQSAVQTFGEQMYDSIYASDKEAGKGAFGAKEIVSADSGEGIGPSIFGYQLGKKAALNDVQSGLYGGIIGGMMEAYHTPVVNQSIYGYLDGKIRDGKGQEGVAKVKKMAEVLLNKGRLSQEQYEDLVGKPAVEAKPAQEGQPEIPAQPAQKGMIDHMAETSAMLKDVNGSKLSPVASYDVYNYQNNQKPVIEKEIHDFSHPADPNNPQDTGGLVQQLAALRQADPNNTPAIAALQAKVADGYSNYTNNIEKHAFIDKHISEVTATGKTKDIQPELQRITDQKHDYKDNPEIAPLMEGFNQEARVKAKEGKTPDENGVKYSDLKGEVVTHIPSGRKGTIVERDNSLPGEEPQVEHYFQPQHTEKDQTPIEVKGDELVDRSTFDHNKTVDNATKEGEVQEGNIAKHQTGDEGGEKTVTSSSDSTPQGGEVKKEVALESLKNKPVTYKGQRGVLSIDEGGKVSFESDSGKTYDIPTEADNRNAFDYGITPIKEKAEKSINVSDVSETNATVNGVKYTIHTNKKTGNIIGLSPENKPEQIIRNEKLITAVEIERNKSAYKEGETESDLAKEKESLPISEHKVVDLVDNIHAKHMDDATSEALDKMMRGNRVSEEEIKLLKDYAEKVGNDLLALQIDGDYGESDVLNSAIENIDLLEKQIKQDESEINSSEKVNNDGDTESQEKNAKEPTAEEKRAEEIEHELETKLEEVAKPEKEAEVAKEAEITKEATMEVAKEVPADSAPEKLLEKISDNNEDKKVAKAKKTKEKKQSFKKIGKKKRNELIMAEAKTADQAAMQRVLGLSELGEELNVDAEAKSETDIWNANHANKITEDEMKNHILEAQKMSPEEIAHKLNEALNTDTDLEALTKEDFC